LALAGLLSSETSIDVDESIASDLRQFIVAVSEPLGYRERCQGLGDFSETGSCVQALTHLVKYKEFKILGLLFLNVSQYRSGVRLLSFLSLRA
jgi:hypothetical protein